MPQGHSKRRPPAAATPPFRPTQDLSQDEDSVDEEVEECLDSVDGALKSTDVIVLRQALKTAYNMITALQKQRNKAREECAEHETQLISIHAFQRKARKMTKANRAQAELDEDISSMIPDDVKKIARALDNGQKAAAYVYFFFWCFSSPPALLTTPLPSFAWDNVQVRFASAANEQAALTAEVYAATAPVFHDYIRYENEAFAKLFHSSCNSLRSSTVNRLRQNASVIFASIVPLFNKEKERLEAAKEWPKSPAKQEALTYAQKLFERSFDRTEVSVFQRLLGFKATRASKPSNKGKEGRQYAKWAPILFLDTEKHLAEELFRNPVLILVCSIALMMLFGPSAASGDPALCKFDQRNPLRGKDRVTTPGLIALCAILARFLLSPDNAFPNYTIGSVSKIDYLGDFNVYKKWLITRWDTPYVKDLVALWNSKVFPRSTARAHPEAESDDDNDEAEDDDQSDREPEPAAFEVTETRPPPEEDGFDDDEMELGDTSVFLDPHLDRIDEEEEEEEDDIINDKAPPRDLVLSPTDPLDDPLDDPFHSSPTSSLPMVRSVISKGNALLIAASSPHKKGKYTARPKPVESSRLGQASPRGQADPLSPSSPIAEPIPLLLKPKPVRKGKGKQSTATAMSDADEDIQIVSGDVGGSLLSGSPVSLPPAKKKKKKVLREVVQMLEVEETDEEDGQEGNGGSAALLSSRSLEVPSAPLSRSSKGLLGAESTSKSHATASPLPPDEGAEAAAPRSRPKPRPLPRQVVAAGKVVEAAKAPKSSRPKPSSGVVELEVKVAADAIELDDDDGPSGPARWAKMSKTTLSRPPSKIGKAGRVGDAVEEGTAGAESMLPEASGSAVQEQAGVVRVATKAAKAGKGKGKKTAALLEEVQDVQEDENELPEVLPQPPKRKTRATTRKT